MSDTELIATCDLCHKPLGTDEAVTLSKWVLHPECKEIAEERLRRFWDWLVSDDWCVDEEGDG